MKRVHRSAHRMVWLLLAPAIAAVLWLAITNRPGPLVNDTLPPSIITDEAPN